MYRIQDRYELVLIDLDGVVWRGGNAIPENVRAIRKLIANGVKVAFLTNNSTSTRRSYAKRLAELGIRVGEDSVVNSGYAASHYLLQNLGPCRVYPVGEEGLLEELKVQGHTIVDRPTAAGVDAVVAGLDRSFNYEKLRNACRLIRRGALYVATNTDATIPVEDGEDPGAGAIVEAISTGAGKRPDIIVGKPNPYMVELVMQRWGVERSKTVIVGDRLETDVECGARAGVDTILVLTGVASREDVNRAPHKPKTIVDNLLEIV